MKISKTANENKEITHYLLAKENNIDVADLYVEYLTYRRDSIGEEEIKSFVEQGYTEEEAFYQCFVQEMDIDESDPVYLKLKKRLKIDDIKLLDESIFQQDPYYQNIRFSDVVMDDIRIANLSYIPYEGFVYDEINVNPDDYYVEKTPIGFYNKEVSFPAIIKNDTIWMSVIPHEINTMKEAIDKVSGKVLILGLGLGYYAYMTSIKENVQSLTIIENDKKVIDIFKKNILNKFTNREKIQIKFGDAFEEVKNLKDGTYDYVFCDIWHNVGDGISMYLKLKKYEKNLSNTKFIYWIETSLLAMLRRQVLTIVEEHFEGLKEKDYLKAKDENDQIINKLYFYLKNYEINNGDDLKKLISDENLMLIAKNLDY